MPAGRSQGGHQGLRGSVSHLHCPGRERMHGERSHAEQDGATGHRRACWGPWGGHSPSSCSQISSGSAPWHTGQPPAGQELRSATSTATGQDSPGGDTHHHPPGPGTRWLTWACLRFLPGRPAFLMGVPGSCFSSLLGFSSGSSSPCQPDTERTVTPLGSPGRARLRSRSDLAGTAGVRAPAWPGGSSASSSGQQH